MRIKACVTVLASLIACPALAAPILSFEPSNTTVAVGTTFSVNINIADAVDLYAFQFDVGFDQDALAANVITEGTFLSNEGATFFIPGSINNAAGSISFTGNTLLSAIPGANGNGTLATISFTALAPSGPTTLNLFTVVLLDSQLSGMASSFVPGAVTVTGQVPEPTAIALLGIGLMSGLYTRRKRS